MCEQSRFCIQLHWPVDTAIVLNNHFVLHGRGLPYIPGEKERVMSWGYNQKHIADLRYRLLQQWTLEEKYGLPESALTNIPNQVLARMLENLGESRAV